MLIYEKNRIYTTKYGMVGLHECSSQNSSKGTQAEFKAVGPNIVYHTALYADGKLRLTGNPFLLDTLGNINYFTPQTECISFYPRYLF